MTDLVPLLAHWGVGLVFALALLEQAGLPLPAAPVLVAAGALAQDGAFRPELALIAALAACLLADHAWFVVGRTHGRKLLAGICRVSVSPDACVSNADGLIARQGASLLLFAKFIPGVSAVAVPMVAARGVSYGRFLLLDIGGASLWCGAYVGVGMIFSREVQRVLDAMSLWGGWAVVLLAALAAIYVALKLAHRYRLRRLHRLVRIAPADAAALLARGELLVVDARSRTAREEDPRRIPHSVAHDGLDLDVLFVEARGRTVVTFCTCPDEASAAFLAERLIKAGLEHVRVLSGGEEALALLSTSASPLLRAPLR